MPTIKIVSSYDAERVLYSAEVSDNVPPYLRMREAVRQAVDAGADLSGAYLSGAYLRGACLRYACLRYANLSGASLSDANLSDANLRGAHLTGTDLSDANLSDANLRGGIKALAAPARRVTRSDGYEFILWLTDAGWRVAAGCRFFSMGEAREHWTRTRVDTDLGIESLDILDFFQQHIDRVAQQEAGGE